MNGILRGVRGAFGNLEVVAPHQKAFSGFGALPGNVVRDPVAPLVHGPQEIAAAEDRDQVHGLSRTVKVPIMHIM